MAPYLFALYYLHLNNYTMHKKMITDYITGHPAVGFLSPIIGVIMMSLTSFLTDDITVKLIGVAGALLGIAVAVMALINHVLTFQKNRIELRKLKNK